MTNIYPRLVARFSIQICWLMIVVSFLPSPAVAAMPDGATAVTDFSLERYLGTWYEIARLDHRFERGLTQVTATYSMRDDGGVRVLNRGYTAFTHL